MIALAAHSFLRLGAALWVASWVAQAVIICGCDVKREPPATKSDCYDHATRVRHHCMSGVTEANAVEQCTAQMEAAYNLCCEQVGCKL